MSVPEQTPVSSYTGNGVATVFAYQFLVTLAADLVVTVNGVVKVNGVDYTVSGLAVQSGGNVTFISGAPALNASIVLKRVIALKRDIDYQYAGDFLASTVNADIDRLWLAAQGTLEQANRAVRMAAGSPAVNLELPAPTPLSHLRWNASANAFEYVLASDSGLISSTAYTRTLLDSVDAPAARSVLDIKASTVPNTPAGTIAATTVQGAINEIVSDLAASSGASLVGGADQVVASIAALRALLKTSASKNAFVTGYYAAGDGGGGAYYYDAADTTTADNGGTVIVATDGGRWKLALSGSLTVKHFGAKGNGVADDTVACQNAINYALANKRNLDVPGMCRITSSLVINRNVSDYPITDVGAYFVISSSSRGGFFTNGALTMFTTTLPYTTSPVSQFIWFDGITFEVDGGGPADGSLATYVLDNNKFLRMRFTACNFLKTKLLTTANYLQTYYFEECNIRDWAGTWLNSTTWNFDLKINSCIVEHSYSSSATAGGFLNIKSPQACAVTNSLLEGIGGRAITMYDTKSIVVSGNYFEGNGQDIQMTSSGPNYSISLIGNSFDREIVWGDTTIGGVSTGNERAVAGNMHTLNATADVFINDTARAGTVSTKSYTNEVILLNRAQMREGKSLDLNAGAAATFSFVFDVSSTYLVSIKHRNGSNAVPSSGLYLLSREGTGVLVDTVKAVNYFVLTINAAFQLVVTNPDTLQRSCTVTALRIA